MASSSAHHKGKSSGALMASYSYRFVSRNTDVARDPAIFDADAGVAQPRLQSKDPLGDMLTRAFIVIAQPCQSSLSVRENHKPVTQQVVVAALKCEVQADSSQSESPTNNRSGHRKLRVSACIQKSQKCPTQHKHPPPPLPSLTFAALGMMMVGWPGASQIARTSASNTSLFVPR
jgi:hypothetical protein